ncbi:unnamed protein product [Alopecurus aequalis]
MDSFDEFFYHEFIETSSDDDSDDDGLLIAILGREAEQNALPKYRGSTKRHVVVNRDRAAGHLPLPSYYFKPALKTPKMADEEHAQTSRKRVADKQINKDNPESDDDSQKQETGTFKRASEEVMAARKIVKVRCQQPSSAPSSNPFSVIRLTPSDSSVQASIPVSNVKGSCSSGKANEGSNCNVKDPEKSVDSNDVAEIQKDESGLKESDAKNKSNAPTEAHSPLTETDSKADSTGNGTEDGDAEEKEVNEDGDEGAEKKDEAGSGTKDVSCEQKDADNKGQPSSPTPLFSFKNLSSGQNAFTGLVGTGYLGSSFLFGSASKDSSNAPLFGLKTDGSSFPSFNIGGTNNNGSSVPALATAAEAPRKFAMPEVPVKTGGENEKAVFTADAAIYEYLDGGWKERGKGELKLNIPVSGGERPRLIMRAKGNYRLILNASLYDDMALKDMEKKGTMFACVNSISESPSGLNTFALKFKDTSVREYFKAAVETHKARKDPDG